jgi:hypothetical protein
LLAYLVAARKPIEAGELARLVKLPQTRSGRVSLHRALHSLAARGLIEITRPPAPKGWPQIVARAPRSSKGELTAPELQRAEALVAQHDSKATVTGRGSGPGSKAKPSTKTQQTAKTTPSTSKASPRAPKVETTDSSDGLAVRVRGSDSLPQYFTRADVAKLVDAQPPWSPRQVTQVQKALPDGYGTTREVIVQAPEDGPLVAFAYLVVTDPDGSTYGMPGASWKTTIARDPNRGNRYGLKPWKVDKGQSVAALVKTIHAATTTSPS